MQQNFNYRSGSDIVPCYNQFKGWTITRKFQIRNIWTLHPPNFSISTMKKRSFKNPSKKGLIPNSKQSCYPSKSGAVLFCHKEALEENRGGGGTYSLRDQSSILHWHDDDDLLDVALQLVCLGMGQRNKFVFIFFQNGRSNYKWPRLQSEHSKRHATVTSYPTSACKVHEIKLQNNHHLLILWRKTPITRTNEKRQGYINAFTTFQTAA